MSTDHEIFVKKTGHHEVFLMVDEQSCEFTITTTDPSGEGDAMVGLTVEELGVVAFRMLEVLSYYDPGFEVSLPKASEYVKAELKGALKCP